MLVEVLLQTTSLLPVCIQSVAGSMVLAQPRAQAPLVARAPPHPPQGEVVGCRRRAQLLVLVD